MPATTAHDVRQISPAHVDSVWGFIAGDIVDCLQKTPGPLSAADYWALCRSGQAFLFLVHEGETCKGAAVWQFQRAYGRNAFNCLMLVGQDLDKWAAALFSAATEYARLCGASALCATGRLGLVQSLKRHIPGLKIVRQSYLVEV